jgi:hypothetical protein
MRRRLTRGCCGHHDLSFLRCGQRFRRFRLYRDHGPARKYPPGRTTPDGAKQMLQRWGVQRLHETICNVSFPGLDLSRVRPSKAPRSRTAPKQDNGHAVKSARGRLMC